MECSLQHRASSPLHVLRPTSHAPWSSGFPHHCLRPHPLPPVCCPQAKECMLFAGTAVASGSGIGVVTSIGMQTEIGKIQSQIAAAAEEEEDTPLKQKLDEFGELLAKVRQGVQGCKWLHRWQGRATQQPSQQQPCCMREAAC